MVAVKKQSTKKNTSKKRVVKGSLQAIRESVKFAQKVGLDFSYLKK